MNNSTQKSTQNCDINNLSFKVFGNLYHFYEKQHEQNSEKNWNSPKSTIKPIRTISYDYLFLICMTSNCVHNTWIYFSFIYYELTNSHIVETENSDKHNYSKINVIVNILW